MPRICQGQVTDLRGLQAPLGAPPCSYSVEHSRISFLAVSLTTKLFYVPTHMLTGSVSSSLFPPDSSHPLPIQLLDCLRQVHCPTQGSGQKLFSSHQSVWNIFTPFLSCNNSENNHVPLMWSKRIRMQTLFIPQPSSLTMKQKCKLAVFSLHIFYKHDCLGKWSSRAQASPLV